jgi:hypothetical protein
LAVANVVISDSSARKTLRQKKCTKAEILCETFEPLCRCPDLLVLGDCNFQLNTTAPPTIILRRAALCVLREIREGKDRIASAFAASADAVVARAPRNDGLEGFCRPFNVIASEAR